MADDDQTQGPRTFLSYSWSSPEHEEWVLQLARDLESQGVDVVFDKWDVRDGDDPFPFMERIVADPALKKVVLICDREYVRKADNREGGVGAEAQILTPQLYRTAQHAAGEPEQQKAETRKFVALLREKPGPNERATPVFYGGRIHIDATDDDAYTDTLDRLARWIYDKPVHERPMRGKPPSFVTDSSAPDTGTSLHKQQAIKALRDGRSGADGVVDDYFETLSENLSRFDLDPDDGRPTQQAVVERAEQLRPVRNEALAVVQALVRYRPEPEGWEPVYEFFQRSLRLFELVQLPGKSTINGWARDHFRLFVPELFLYTATALLRRKRFDALNFLLSEELQLESVYRGSGLVPFYKIQQGSDALKRYQQDENAHWVSPEGAWLRNRSEDSPFSFVDVMQADLVLALRSRGDEYFGSWWPNTLAYAERRTAPFELFARAKSADFFERLKPVLGVGSADELRAHAATFGSDGRLFEYRVDLPDLIGSKQLATQP